VDKVPAVTRAIAVLRVLAEHPAPMPAAAVARELSLARSTVYQLLGSLEAAALVTHLPEERTYGLGVGVFELGSAYLRNQPLERLSRPLLVRLVGRTQATAHLGVLHGAETLYLLKEQPRQPVTLVTDVGVRLPAHLTAVGRSMLAHLPPAQVRALFPSASSFVDRTGSGPRSLAELRSLLGEERRRGWAEEDGHVTAGLASVAAPAFDHLGRPIAAIGLTFPSSDRSRTDRAELAEDVRRSAATLTRRMSGHLPR
jgi:DNA-binding IclR family transcriptional regulator